MPTICCSSLSTPDRCYCLHMRPHTENSHSSSRLSSFEVLRVGGRWDLGCLRGRRNTKGCAQAGNLLRFWSPAVLSFWSSEPPGHPTLLPALGALDGNIDNVGLLAASLGFTLRCTQSKNNQGYDNLPKVNQGIGTSHELDVDDAAARALAKPAMKARKQKGQWGITHAISLNAKSEYRLFSGSLISLVLLHLQLGCVPILNTYFYMVRTRLPQHETEMSKRRLCMKARRHHGCKTQAAQQVPLADIILLPIWRACLWTFWERRQRLLVQIPCPTWRTLHCAHVYWDAVLGDMIHKAVGMWHKSKLHDCMDAHNAETVEPRVSSPPAQASGSQGARIWRLAPFPPNASHVVYPGKAVAHSEIAIRLYLEHDATRITILKRAQIHV